MEENGLEFSVNNEESILGKSSDRMKKIKDVENDGYQRRNVACGGSETSCDVTQRCKLKIQQRDNGNFVAGKGEQTHRTIRQKHATTMNKTCLQLLLTNLLF